MRAVSTDAWLPKERIAAEDQILVGYVLGTDGDWVSVSAISPATLSRFDQTKSRTGNSSPRRRLRIGFR